MEHTLSTSGHWLIRVEFQTRWAWAHSLTSQSPILFAGKKGTRVVSASLRRSGRLRGGTSKVLPTALALKRMSPGLWSFVTIFDRSDY